MDSATNNITNNTIYGLKKKDFILKLAESESAGDYPGSFAVMILAARTDKGSRIGWLIGFNHEADDSLYHLLNNKGDERVFKTIDAATSFLLEIHISGEVTIKGTTIHWG